MSYVAVEVLVLDLCLEQVLVTRMTVLVQVDLAAVRVVEGTALVHTHVARDTTVPTCTRAEHKQLCRSTSLSSATQHTLCRKTSDRKRQQIADERKLYQTFYKSLK